MKRTYRRSQILFFFELSKEQQAVASKEIDSPNEKMYVLWDNEPICLDMFIRTDSGLFHGAYGTSAFSAYLIRINKTQEFATVVYAHW